MVRHFTWTMVSISDVASVTCASVWTLSIITWSIQWTPNSEAFFDFYTKERMLAPLQYSLIFFSNQSSFPYPLIIDMRSESWSLSIYNKTRKPWPPQRLTTTYLIQFVDMYLIICFQNIALNLEISSPKDSAKLGW